MWHACPTWHAERFPWHAVFNAVPNFFISFARPASLYCDEYVYIFMYLTAWRLYMNCLCRQIVLRVKLFTKTRERRDVLLVGYLPMGRRPGGDWANT